MVKGIPEMDQLETPGGGRIQPKLSALLKYKTLLISSHITPPVVWVKFPNVLYVRLFENCEKTWVSYLD